MANILRETFDSKDEWPMKQVTVYNDRAQVTRILDYKVTDHGEVELKLENLPMSLMTDSVRAEIETSNAVIYEVSTTLVNPEYEPPIDNERMKEIREEQKKLREEVAALNARKQWLDKYAQRMVPTAFKEDSKGKELFDAVVGDKNLENFETALTRYAEETMKIDEGVIDTNIKIQELDTEYNKIYGEINAGKNTKPQSYSAMVLINVPEEVVAEQGIVTVRLNYSTRNASWSAKYDVRVVKADNDVDVSYFGLVKNSTGEDWSDVELSLSTAKPSKGGVLPPLPRMIARLRKKNEVSAANLSMKPTKKLLGKMKMKKEEVAEKEAYSESDSDDEEDWVEQQQLQQFAEAPTSSANDKGGFALFKMNRMCTIESDYKDHRQTIGEFKLQPLFTWVVSPKASPDCFLRCTTKNDSEFVLIPGPMAVFFNGSFVTKSEMKMVNKGESFSVYLGTEESVKVDYQPEKSNQELTKGGFITSKHNVKTVTRIINIENTRAEEISLLLLEQIPVSKNDKVKVEVVSPNLESKAFRVSKTSVLEARSTVKAGGKYTMDFTYKIEWPNKEKIAFSEDWSGIDK